MIFAMVVLTPGSDWSRRMWRHSAVTSPFIQSRSRRFLSSGLWGRRRRGRALRHRVVLLLTFLTSLPTRDDCTHWARCDACLALSDHKTRCEVLKWRKNVGCCSVLPVSSRFSFFGFNSCASRMKRIRSAFFKVGSPVNKKSAAELRYVKKPRTLIGVLKPDKNI